MARIEDASVRMATIVEDLLALARHEHGPVLVREPVAVAEIARNVVEDARMSTPDRNIRLELDNPGIVSGDATRIHQALSNLVDNAMLHTPPGTAVEIVASSGDGTARLEVRDHGPGVAPEHVAHVFEPFYRVDPGRSRHTGGAGLGLAITDAIVRAHGGTIAVTTTPGGGATFVIELPSDGSAAAEPDPTDRAPILAGDR
jgi:two-component system OmpR family sensor kinase